MNNTPAVRQQGFALTSDEFETMQRMAKAMVASNYFSDVKDVAQAIVKIQAGSELGIPPFAALTGIHIIKNKPVLGANLIATLIKSDDRYDYRVTRLDDEGCAVDFYENGEKVGQSSFTSKDAKAAGLRGDNWSKYPRNMYFARAISNGAKWYTPGVFSGATIYTADEMGVDEDMDGNIIDGTLVEVNTDTIEEKPDVQRTTNGPKPFYATVRKDIAYFTADKHVQHTMALLDLEYPSNADEAKHALATLAQYATLRADGTDQADAVALLNGELALQREEAE